MINISISKRKLEITGIVLLSVLFIFDGLQKLLDTEKEQNKFNLKMNNL